MKSVTGEDGSYSFRCKADSYTMNAILDGYQSYVKQLTVYNGNRILNVIMFKASSEPPPNGTVITGKVTDAKTGSPILGVKVKAGNYSATTGTGGVYTLGVEMGTYNVIVSLEGYKTETAQVAVTEKKNYVLDVSITQIPIVKVTVVPNYVDTHLGRVAVVNVVVQKTDRTPAAGVTVQFTYAKEEFLDMPAKFDPQTVVTDHMGTATVNWIVLLEPLNPITNTWWFCTITASATVDGLEVEGLSYVTVLQPCPSCTLN